jgi:hypothetical protein
MDGCDGLMVRALVDEEIGDVSLFVGRKKKENECQE